MRARAARATARDSQSRDRDDIRGHAGQVPSHHAMIMQRFTDVMASILGERQVWQWLLPVIFFIAIASLLRMTIVEYILPAAGVTTWIRTSRLILQGTGLSFVMAFGSLRCQLLGLCGPSGVCPAAEILDGLEQAYETSLNRRRVVLQRMKRHADDPELWARMQGALPPRFDLRLVVQRAMLATWHAVGTSESSLLGLCNLGLLCGLLLLLAPQCSLMAPRCAQPVALVVAWWVYLVLKRLCREFLNLQWDALLLEVAVLAWPLSFHGVLPSSLPPIIWTLQLCTFKLLFSSGVVKLRSGCLHWRQLTAMTLHYETQPLPHMLSWFAHGLPESLHRLSAFACLVIELPIPLLIFATPLPLVGAACRLVAFVAISGLMLLIALTGNYGFFNALTIVLAVSLLSDQQLDAMVSSGIKECDDSSVTTLSAMTASTMQYLHLVLSFTVVPLVGLAASIPICSVGRFASTPYELPSLFQRVFTLLAPLGIGKSYGLFASMTTFRWELVIEGSLTGAADSWVEITFPNKPSSVQHHPVLVWPGHLPRLEWMLWFVSLRMSRGGLMPQWCERFIFLILCGADLRAPRDLLANNPFADSNGSGAPKYVRVSLFDYHLSNCSHSREPHEQPERAALQRHRAKYNLKGGASTTAPKEAAPPIAVEHNATGASGKDRDHEQWEGDRQSGAWWRRQFVREVGRFKLAVVSTTGKVARDDVGADVSTLSSMQRMAMCQLDKVDDCID